jgi:hypothetical protein
LFPWIRAPHEAPENRNRRHKYRIMNLLNLHTVADLARYAQRRGIVE